MYADIRAPELLQNLPLPLAKEAIIWPHKNILCFPTFTCEELSESHHSCHDNPPEVGRTEERDELVPNSVSIRAEEKRRTSTPKNSPPVDPSLPLARTAQNASNDKHDIEQFDETSIEYLLKSLPNEREALLELKSQLTMELLWIKQAIASRQEVCVRLSTELCAVLIHMMFLIHTVFTTKTTLTNRTNFRVTVTQYTVLKTLSITFLSKQVKVKGQHFF